MLTLFTGGDVYAPAHVGRPSVLVCMDRIVRVGDVDVRALEQSGLGLDVIDVRGHIITPGLIDAHEHLTGGSGEEGFGTQTPEIQPQELVRGGITTVVGCLGVDTTTRTMPQLLGKVRSLLDHGLSAFFYTGGYDVPPVTLTGSVRSDVMFIPECIGAGEIAISDARSTRPSVDELARVVADASNGGLLSGKAGITHFHVGDDPSGLSPLRELLSRHHVPPASVYPTHVERRTELMLEAVELSKRGVAIDVDVVDEDLHRWVRFHLDHGGRLEMLTATSDAGIPSPMTLLGQLRDCVLHHGFTLQSLLPVVTANPARVLKLRGKGALAEGADADVLVLSRDALEPVHVMARGKLLMRGGALTFKEHFLTRSNRKVVLHGGKT